MLPSKYLTILTIITRVAYLQGYNLTMCRAGALKNTISHSGYRFECKTNKPTNTCKISETFPDGTLMYCSFNKTYIENDFIQGFNLVKSYCNGKKPHEFLLRIGHGELLSENQCVFDIEGIDISGIFEYSSGMPFVRYHLNLPKLLITILCIQLSFLNIVIKRWAIRMGIEEGSSLYHRFDSTDIVDITDIEVQSFGNHNTGKNDRKSHYFKM